MERLEIIARRSPAVRSTSGANGNPGSRARPGVEALVGRRIMRELHDTVKQNLCGATMMIEACVEAQEGNAPRSLVRELLDRALEMSREAERQLSKPLDELGTSHQNAVPAAYLKERFERLGRYFGIETHVNLQASLESLSSTQLAVVHRVCMEASWNAARHSGAKNLWLESRLSGSVFVLALRDDGRGFHAGEVSGGLGLGSMRSRAEEVGAALKLHSTPGEGTTVCLRLPVRRGVREARG